MDYNYNDWREYLQHGQDWSNHKYILKIGTGNLAKYFYTREDIQKLKNKGSKKKADYKSKNSKKKADNKTTNKTSKKSKKKKVKIKKSKKIAGKSYEMSSSGKLKVTKYGRKAKSKSYYIGDSSASRSEFLKFRNKVVR